jgi:hypothetical protein
MAWWRRREDEKVDQPVAASTPAPLVMESPASPPAARPSSPRGASPIRGTPVKSWATGLRTTQVVGESYHTDSFRAIRDAYKNRRAIPVWGLELEDVDAVVAAEPSNEFDPNAVAVYVEGHLVGSLMRQTAPPYSDRLVALARDGKYLVVPARVWIAENFRGDGPHASVTIQLPEPEGIQPFNELPDERYTVVPAGSPLKVKVDADPKRLFESYVLGKGPRYVATTLHVVDGLVEFRLDGERVGILTKSSSDKTRELVEYVTAEGFVCVGRAVLKGSVLGAELTAHIARTSEIPQSWLENLPRGA